MFLDEVTTGLDPQGRRVMWDLIRDINDQGKTVLLTTHFMEEAERLCRRVAVMDQGRILVLDSPENLVRDLGVESKIVFSYKDSWDPGKMRALPSVRNVEAAGGRAAGILRRFKTTPLRPLALLAADVIVVFVMTAFGMALLIAAARIFYGLKFTGDALGFGLAFLLCCLCFFSLGFILAAVVKTARTAQITGMAFFFPMIFLSGATIPVEIMPANVQALSRFVPLTYVVRILKGLWFGQEWSRFGVEAALLLALAAVSLAVTVKIFRWE